MKAAVTILIIVIYSIVLLMVAAVCYSQDKPDSIKIVFDKDGNIFRQEYFSTNKNVTIKKKTATMLRNKAEAETVGLPVFKTRDRYRKLKKEYKEKTKVIAAPKFKVSKRQQRLTA